MDDKAFSAEKNVAAAVIVFFAVSLGLVLAVSLLMALLKIEVKSGAGGLFITVIMLAPLLGRFAAVRTVDRGWKAPFRLRSWGRPRWFVALAPLLILLAIYGAAYLVGSLAGIAAWNPGNGKWTSAGQIALNLAFNLPIMAVFFTIGSLGEELGWRGYLQPRLDAAGVRLSLVVVIVLEVIWHVPIFVLANFLLGGSLAMTVLLFAGLKMFASPLWAWSVYRSRSIWPAVFFHTFHNEISQWLFPHFFSTTDDGVLLGEFGVLPVAAYAAAFGIWLVAMLVRGTGWQKLAARALTSDLEK
ncbi:MAG: CPBP family intramembrane glutamic endopeptidase [Pseudomonadota bacterium]